MEIGNTAFFHCEALSVIKLSGWLKENKRNII